MTDHLAASLRGYDPALRPPTLLDGDVSFVVDDTAVGRMLLATRPDGTALVSTFTPTDADVDRVLERLARVVSPRVLRGGHGVDRLRGELDAYLAGRARGFTVPVDLALATPFQQVVLTRLQADVGYGVRTTYGALAVAAGRPTASRAVGAALGANPLCVVLPCHRVVASSGALTGYAGGVAAKQRLLDLESGTLPLS
jgi:methylated-DNA-[protein]-cysteine S-methyltransferase